MNIAMAAAPAASNGSPSKPRPAPVPVRSRATLWEGGVISLKVPAMAQCQTGAAGKVTYLQFFRHVKGGGVNFYIHHINPTSLAGKRVRARMSVMQKDLEDDRSYLHIDLVPVKDHEPVTHRLIIESTLALSVHPKKVLFQVQTPSPLAGIIVVTAAEPDEKTTN